MLILDVQPGELATVLALNEAAVPHVNSVDLEQMEWFAANAPYFRVARDDAGIAGFMIGLRPGLSYGSPNYAWFSANYDDFGYIDRVVVAPAARRLGVAKSLYDDFAAGLKDQVPVLTCEVNLRPANEASMRYHEQYGFVQVASQQIDDGDKEVALMEKRL
jgi:hypothetical protein